jgi:hypothetical protein
MCSFFGYLFIVYGICRPLSTINPPTIPLGICGTVATKDESRDFMAVFPDIVRDLTETGRHLDIPDATKWFAKVSILVTVNILS